MCFIVSKLVAVVMTLASVSLMFLCHWKYLSLLLIGGIECSCMSKTVSFQIKDLFVLCAWVVCWPWKTLFPKAFLDVLSKPLYLLSRCCSSEAGKSENVCKYRYKLPRIMRFKNEETCFLVTGITQSPNHLLHNWWYYLSQVFKIWCLFDLFKRNVKGALALVA